MSQISTHTKARPSPRSEASVRSDKDDPGRRKNERGSKQSRRKVRFATLNVGSLTGRTVELVEAMVEKTIDICAVQETKWLGAKAREIGNKAKLWYSGGKEAKNGVGIIVRGPLIEEVTGVKRAGDRIMGIKVNIGTERMFIVSCYAPQTGLKEDEKEKFYDDLSTFCGEKEDEEVLLVMGDFNGHVGRERSEWKTVHGGHGYGIRNDDGERLLDWALDRNMVLMNTFFKQRDSHLITYSSGGRNTQIDYICIDNKRKQRVLNCKTIPSISVTSQHVPVIMDYKEKRLKRKVTNRESGEKRIKWWQIRNKELREKFTIELKTSLIVKTLPEDPDNCWKDMKSEIVKAAEMSLGMTRDREKGRIRRDESFWNNDVKNAIEKKKKCRKAMHREGTDCAKEAYTIAKKEAKKRVAQAKATVERSLYDKLNSREGEKEIYRIARMRDKKSKDISSVKQARDKNGIVLYEEDTVRDRWREHFEEMGNIKFGVAMIPPTERISGPTMKIEEEEVKEAIKRMRKGKATGPDDIPTEAFLSLGDYGVRLLTSLFNNIISHGSMPVEWSTSTTIPIYKKGDPLNCENYRPVRLLCHAMKIYERVLERRLRERISITKNQCGFVKGVSTTDAIFALSQTLEKYREKKRKVHLTFIDLKSAFDSVSRELIVHGLRDHGVEESLINAVMLTYYDAKSSVRSAVGRTKDFSVGSGTHQGSALSPLLFITVLDTVTKDIQREVPYTIMYADDIVLVAEERADLQRWTEQWKVALEEAGLRMNLAKTEYMEYGEQTDGSITVGGRELPKTRNFAYLGSMVCAEGSQEEAVIHRIQCGWLKWRSCTGVTCDKKIPVRLKGKIHRTVTRPALIYGCETFAQSACMNRRMSTTEMRMLRWTIGVTRLDRIRNEVVRERLGVAPIVDKMRESRLRWLGHVERRENDSVINTARNLNVEGVRPRGRPKLRWKDTVEKDMKEMGIGISLAKYREKWKKKTHVADPVT